MADSLEARIARIEDRFAISDLVVRYATLLDDAQWDALGELFTEDGVFGSPHSTTVGRAAVVENFRVKHAPFTWTWHDPHGHVVEFDDEGRVATRHAKVFCAIQRPADPAAVEQLLDELSAVTDEPPEVVRARLRDLVPEYVLKPGDVATSPAQRTHAK